MLPEIKQEELFSEMAVPLKNRYRFDNAEHLHILDGKNLYGTTTVLGIIAKPLTWWASGMACATLGWINPKPSRGPIPSRESVLAAAKIGFDSIKAMDLEQYTALLSKAYKAHSKELDRTAVAGVDLHAECETYILYCLKNNGGKPVELVHMDARVQSFAVWAMSHVKQFLWAEMNHYSEKLWVGGQSDLGYIDLEGKLVLGDIKSAKEAYFSHFCQMGAYDIQIMENGGFDPMGNQTFQVPNLVGFHRYEVFAMGQPNWNGPAVEVNTGLYKRAFEAALELFKAKEAFEVKNG